ncbi:peptide-methionine (S)-S-oxide reductase MsrA [Limoniibacter endophyticus]|uniref:Peptide methionine sulfoxide reductase MsrA n=1 Tax=Limoniibacter endophyticus TaxID=1565040 RepID=A0A8J3DHA5_9HYPH|nr:peptide-methionine (S)-S-oxide reductase MsrA [Limoniibacter endophyticus]GHC66597.1 peptide methionine sulfoxide reductase MsrA 1 [Limoniibacter endophyticus]
MFSFDALSQKTRMPEPGDALQGRPDPVPTSDLHFVSGKPIQGPYPENLELVEFGLGCFWGAERLFWQLPGVYVTSVGYEGGYTPNPTYEETCTGKTGHAEVVRVVFDPAKISFARLLQVFWESHDPTQGMRQGNDIGTTYRSVIFTHSDEHLQEARASKVAYQAELAKAGRDPITTEILPAQPYYFAEDYHQQYLAKNPGGYCGLQGTGVTCPLPAK